LAEERVKSLECGEVKADEEPTETPFAVVAVGRNIGPRDIVSVPCRSEGVGHDAVYGLLMERLQDVCVHFVYFASLCIDDYVYNF
jgi:hypothetical protein